MAVAERKREDERVLLIAAREEASHRSTLEELASLTERSWRIERMGSLEEALAGLLADPPNLIAIDFGSQPAHAGLELLAALTAVRSYCPVLALPAGTHPSAPWTAMAPSVYSTQDRTERAFDRLLRGTEKRVDFFRPVDFLAIAEAGRATLRLNLRTSRIALTFEFCEGHLTAVKNAVLIDQRALRLLSFVPVSQAMFEDLEATEETGEQPYEEALELLAVEATTMEMFGEPSSTSADPPSATTDPKDLGDSPSAKADLEEAFAKGIGAVLAHDVTRAERAFERILGEAPWDPGARFHLSRLENLKAREQLLES